MAPANTDLHKAAHKGDKMKVAALIEAGADCNAVNADGSTPLHSALYFDKWTYSLAPSNWPFCIWANQNKWMRAKQKFEVADLLLKKGGNPGIKNKYGLTPFDIVPSLGELAQCGLADPILWLVERDRSRWDPTQVFPKDRKTPLFAAAWCGQNFNVGKAAHIYVVEGKVLTIRFLRIQGCNPDHKDIKGVSARNVCTVTYWTRKHAAYAPPIWNRLAIAMSANVST